MEAADQQRGCAEVSVARATGAAGPHVLVFPLPLQGHATPMLNLAEALSLRGLHVTFLTTDHVHDRLRRCADFKSRLCRHPGLRLLSISDGLPADNPRSMDNMGEMYLSLRTVTRLLFRDLLRSMRAEQEEQPPVTCVIADILMDFASEVAEELKIPAIIFCTSSPCSFWASFCIPRLIESGELPFADYDMDETVRGVPGVESFLRRRDLPSYCRAKDANEPPLQCLAMVTQNTTRARGLILNTMEPLDALVLAHIRRYCPVTYAVGPLHTLLRTLLPPDAIGSAAAPPPPPPSSSCSSGVWQEDHTCMTWLDSLPPRSVVYVSFGSLGAVAREQLLEFWHGLVNSGHRFLFVIRPEMVAEMEAAGEIPGDVAQGTEERGLVVGWAPQQEVLTHPAVGAFLTHSGWNSTLESICAGVPMVCWPFFFDQLVNSRFVSEVWRAGVDMKDTCDRGNVERMVREVMGGDTGEGIRRAAAAMAELGRGCTAEGGSSRTSLEKLIQDVRATSTEAPGTGTM